MTKPGLWDERSVAVNGCLHWVIGPLSLWLERRAGDWRLAWSRSEDPLAAEVRMDAEAVMQQDLEQVRFGGGASDGSARLRPLLPDRPVIVRPQQPITLLPEDELRIFTSLPLWLQPMLLPSQRELTRLPVFPASDTWFGPDTQEGELGYASRTTARLRMDELPRLHHRAICSLLLRNLGSSKLSVPRVRIPVQYLGLYETAEGTLATQDLDVQLEEAGHAMEIRALRTIGGGLPFKGRELMPPHELPKERGVLDRMLHRMIG